MTHNDWEYWKYSKGGYIYHLRTHKLFSPIIHQVNIDLVTDRWVNIDDGNIADWEREILFEGIDLKNQNLLDDEGKKVVFSLPKLIQARKKCVELQKTEEEIYQLVKSLIDDDDEYINSHLWDYLMNDFDVRRFENRFVKLKEDKSDE